MPRLARGSRNEQATSSTAKGPGANGRSFARNTPREKRREEETSGQIETQRRARENGIPLLPNRKRERERERERERKRENELPGEIEVTGSLVVVFLDDGKVPEGDRIKGKIPYGYAKTYGTGNPRDP